MKGNKVFCENCRNDVHYTVKTSEKTGKIREKEYHYAGKDARCVYCGSYVDVDQICEYNLEALYNEFRKENNIVSLDTIREIPTKYGIEKRQLSLLLGWGEHTFERYCNGDIPSLEHSEKLQRIFDDPQYYAEII